MTTIFDMPEAQYHAHEALSSTNARRLLASPAKYKFALANPEEPKAAFDLGHAVHAAVLGVGAQTVVIPEEVLAANGAVSTAAAKNFIATARYDGKIPVKQSVYDEVHAMKESVLAHPMARALFEQPGNPEVSMFGTDPETEVRIRARFDFLPTEESTHRVAVDLKTDRDASPAGFARSAASHGYGIQRGHYDDTNIFGGAFELGGFVFVVVESEAPYLVGVYRLNTEWEEIGKAKARRARELFAECTATDTWPGYGDDIQSLMAPFWLIADAAEVPVV